MAIEGDPAHSQQGTIVDFEPNGDGCVARFLPHDSDVRLGMAELIQSGANCEGDPMKRRRIGGFTERGRSCGGEGPFF